MLAAAVLLLLLGALAPGPREDMEHDLKLAWLGGASAGGSSTSGKANDDAVDAEFEEVKDKKKAS